MLKRIKVITSYAADARWFAEVGETLLGYIPRQPDILTPYASSPSHIVWDWQGTPVIHAETRHRRYEVFAVPRDMIQPDETAILAVLGA